MARIAASLAWFPSAVLLLIQFSASFAVAAMVFVRRAGAGANLVPPLRFFMEGLALGVAYAAGALIFALVVALMRQVLRLRGTVGSIPFTSPKMLGWYHGLLSTYAVHALSGRLLRSTGLYSLWARMMGMRIGRGSIVNSLNVYDHDLITVGNGVVIGGDAWLLPHVAEHGHIVRAPITIGDGAHIGLQAVILPGATIGRNCQVGAMALVPKGAVLEDDSVYAGIPARRIGKA